MSYLGMGRFARAAIFLGLAAGCAKSHDEKCGIAIVDFGDTIEYSNPDLRRMFIYYRKEQCFDSKPVTIAIDAGIVNAYSDCGLDPYQRLEAKKRAKETTRENALAEGDNNIIETQNFQNTLDRVETCKEA